MTSQDVMTPRASKPSRSTCPPRSSTSQVNIPLIHQVVVAQQAAARQGTHSTKTRGEVRGGGRKPYKQKGTGRARQGSIRAPQFAGGGIVHGPQPRDYDQRTPKKMKAAALRGALSDRARDGRIHVVESLGLGRHALDQGRARRRWPRSRDASPAPRGARARRRRHLALAAQRDLVHVLAVDQLNTYDVLLCRRRDLHQGCVRRLRRRRLGRPSARRRSSRPAGRPSAAVVAEEVEEQPSRPRSPPRPRPKTEPRLTRPRRREGRRCPRAPRPRSRAAARPRATRSRATPTPVCTTSPTASGTTRPRPSSASRPPRTPRPPGFTRCRWQTTRGGRQVSTLHKDHRDVLIAPGRDARRATACSTRTSTPSWSVRTPTRPRSRSRSRRSSTSRSPASTRSTAPARPVAPATGWASARTPSARSSASPRVTASTSSEVRSPDRARIED